MTFDIDSWYNEEIPPPIAAPCKECPWRRQSAPGYLGPHTAEEWVEMIHGEGAIACHMTIVKTDERGIGSWDSGMRQCKGAAIFRGNVLKNPRRPQVAEGIEQNTDIVFASSKEFIEHHER